jgi:uncharacterized protein YjbI with pentapeptide repeats
VQRGVLEGASLGSATFDNANLSGANLRFTHYLDWSPRAVKGKYPGRFIDNGFGLLPIFRDTSTYGPTFVRANLRRADLTGANLKEANFLDAYMQGANLTDANVEDANLEGANLEGVIRHQPNS